MDLVEGIDKSLGDIMNYLEENNLDKNIILFMSDNGGLSAVDRGGEKYTYNKPLSSEKGFVHEGGIREPMLVKWSGVVEENAISDNYLIIEDFFSSILEMAEVKDMKTVQEIDDVSFIPILKPEKVLKKHTFFVLELS